MANENNAIGINFPPCEPIVLNVGETIPIDDTSGMLPIERVDGVEGVMSAEEAVAIWNSLNEV